jgi:hypothetical protein
MGKRGPKPKEKGTRYVIRTFSCPPELWEEAEKHIPTRERSAVIQECLRREVKRRKREGAGEEKPPAP